MAERQMFEIINYGQSSRNNNKSKYKRPSHVIKTSICFSFQQLKLAHVSVCVCICAFS